MGYTLGSGIDRGEAVAGDILRFKWVDTVFGMHHLQPLRALSRFAIALYPLTMLQGTVLLRIEVKQAHVDKCTIVVDANQQAATSAELNLAAFNRAQDQSRLTMAKLVNGRDLRAIFEPGRQVKQQVKRRVQAQAGQFFRKRRAYAVKRSEWGMSFRANRVSPAWFRGPVP